MERLLNKKFVVGVTFILCFLSLLILCGCNDASKTESNTEQEVVTETEVTGVQNIVLLGEYQFGTGSMYRDSYSPQGNKILLNTRTQQVSFYALNTTYDRYVKYELPIAACMIIYQDETTN